MVIEPPVWQYTPQHTLTLGYDHVHLFVDHVVGQWYCLERATGKQMWDLPISKADSVAGVSEGLIVATGSHESGPATSTFGIYGISLESGESLWNSHYSKPLRRSFASWTLWFLPVVYEDNPYGIRGPECLTQNGRVLDIRTGRELRRESSREGWIPFWEDDSPARDLYRQKAVDCGGGRMLHHGAPGSREESKIVPRNNFRLFATEPGGRVRWTFDLVSTGHFIGGNYYSYRYSNGFVYMVVADRPPLVPKDPQKPLIVVENPSNYFLWTLDTKTGQIVQKVPLSTEPTTRCRIEDLDVHSLLLTCGGK